MSDIDIRADMCRIFETAPVVFVVIDTHGNVLECAGDHSFRGRTAEEMAGRNFFDDYGADSEIVEHYRRVLETGLPLHADITGTGGGEWRAFYAPVFDGDRIVGAQALAVDVTGERSIREDLSAAEDQLHLTEDQLRQSEERYRILAETAADVIWTADADLALRFVSPAVVNVLGYTVTDAETMSLASLLNEEDAATLRAFVEKGMRHLNEYGLRDTEETFEMQMRRRDGSTIWTESALRFVCDSREYPGWIFGITRDIHERKTAQDAEALQRRALEEVYRISMHSGMPLEKICVEVSDALERLLEPSRVVIRSVNRVPEGMRTRCTGKRFCDVCDESDPCGPCERIASDGAPLERSGMLDEEFPEAECLGDGGFRSYAGVPVKREDGEVTAVLSVMDTRENAFGDREMRIVEVFAVYLGQEIDRVRLEEELRRSEQERMLGALVAGVAHEVRNPLNALRMTVEVMSEAIRAGKDPEKYFERIHRQVNRLGTLTNDLLELRRPIEPSRFVELDAPRLLSHIMHEIRDAGVVDDMERVRLENECDAATVVPVDLDRIAQVFINLTENAAQHSPDDAPVTVALKRHGGEAVFHVVDCGPGIDDEDRDEIFSPFFTTRKDGSGLGLSIVRHIVERHGGTVRVRNNTPEPGCAFEVRLPCSDTKG